MTNHDENVTSQISRSFLNFVLYPDQERQQSLYSLLQSIIEHVQFDRMCFELLYLRTFMVDYTTTLLFGESQLRNNILDSFYEQLKSAANDSPVHTVLLEGVKSRLALYAEAVNEPLHNELGWNVGTVFAGMLEQEQNSFVVMVGDNLYKQYYQQISQLVLQHHAPNSEYH
ncbi:hypothetical protein [Effusibacillus dendaii]|uniref:Uncharacterized protein n=1 Tax=Effusibacillus dendaii TaxID=2743772 RepID=A0A7I8DAA8_9BACL|nr:hypothetical protein [Effusibacillus dendaii]BCJ87123.1 hypothetical protein skT53_21080 [Effusibacillus dendaii]